MIVSLIIAKMIMIMKSMININDNHDDNYFNNNTNNKDNNNYSNDENTKGLYSWSIRKDEDSECLINFKRR